MPKPYGGKRKRSTSAGVVKLARAINRASGPSPMQGVSFSGLSAPLRTGGFYGQWNRPVTAKPELKVIDIALTNQTVAAAGNVILLNGVATGTDFTSRIGRKIVLKSLLLRANSYYTAAVSTQVGDNVRVMVVCDNQANGAAPAVTDILVAADPVSPMNLNNRDRFRVLMDKVINHAGAVFAAGALTNGSPSMRSIKKYIKLNMESIYSGTGATVGSLASGALYLVLIGFNNNATDFDYITRVRFIDP